MLGRRKGRAARGALVTMLVLAALPRHRALIDPHLWAGTVPVLALDRLGSDLLPAALVGSVDQAQVGAGELPPGLGTEDAPAPPDSDSLSIPRSFTLGPVNVDALTEAQRLLLEEGQRLSQSIEQMRAQLEGESSVTTEDAFKEMQRAYERLNAIQSQFATQLTNQTNALQPLVADVLNQVGRSLAPLTSIAETCAGRLGDRLSKDLTRVVLGPAVTEALASLQALTGLAAMVEVADVVGRIKSTCSAESRTCATMKKALQHLNRAESDVVSAHSALDRIVSDALADRPLLNKDVNLFNVEQHDLAVQLANVRSNLDTAHTLVSRDVSMLGNRSARWGIISVLLAIAGNAATPAPGLLGPFQGLSVVSAVSASALSLLARILGGRRLDRLSEMQERHDTALAEHAALQAQFSQVEAPVAQPVHVKNAQPVYVHAGNVRQQLKQLAANVYDASASVAAGVQDGGQSSNAINAFRELISGLSCIRAQTPGPEGEAEEDTVRALLPLLDTLAAAQQGNATAEEAQHAVNTALELVRQRIESGDPPSAQTAQLTNRRGATPAPGRTRRSGIRPPSVAPGLTPAPAEEQGRRLRHVGSSLTSRRGASKTPRPSGIRPPSLAPSQTPLPMDKLGPERRRQSLTPGPNSLVRRQSNAPKLSRTPEPDEPSRISAAFGSQAYVHTSGSRRSVTPGTRISSLGSRRQSSVGPSGRASSVCSRASSAGPPRLEDELLKLVMMRMQVTSDLGKKKKLQDLAYQLQDVTRAARQQLQTSRRTEHVLKDCVDPTLAHKILQAQHELTMKTQNAMRTCLKETMAALEEECDVNDQLQIAAGMGGLRVGNEDANQNISARLADVRAGVEKALEVQQEELASISKDAGGAASCSQQEGGESLRRARSPSVGFENKLPGQTPRPRERGDGTKAENPGSGWQMFLQRQADAARSKLQRRLQSVERDSLTPRPAITHTKSSRSHDEHAAASKAAGSSVTPQDFSKARASPGVTPMP